MKYFFLILGILIVLDIGYFSYLNQGYTLIINYKPLIGDVQIQSGMLYLFMGIYGLIGGILLSGAKIISLKDELKKVRRKTEKSSIESEESQDKVKALESKIQTLETALKESLNK
ncbi:MAG TPA: hypothetical protein P5556_01745 [Candidatus Gastranaerophilales bacterium]|nr:hypothetical protein [Candidatus Gastranaerophilales bacterium]